MLVPNKDLKNRNQVRIWHQHANVEFFVYNTYLH